VGEPQGGQRPVLLGEEAHRLQQHQQLALDQAQGLLMRLERKKDGKE
jgi:hypothetical protein